MPANPFKQGALVKYKSAPAKVISAGDKIEIEFLDGKTQKVREKDIEFVK